ncbi:MAG TPA: hypothetical protein VMS64_16670 [Candidatus Methylomirabilis sp.]|nr:hypothetical protein [Candidatus Methylomirabilis sp.]
MLPIAAYPGGGGSYTVASENLGTCPGLVAAAALIVDHRHRRIRQQEADAGRAVMASQTSPEGVMATWPLHGATPFKLTDLGERWRPVRNQARIGCRSGEAMP